MTGVQFWAGAIMGFFLFATMSRPTMGHTHSPFQWVPGTVTSKGKVIRV